MLLGSKNCCKLGNCCKLVLLLIAERDDEHLIIKLFMSRFQKKEKLIFRTGYFRNLRVILEGNSEER